MDVAAEATLVQVLADDPQAHGYVANDWTASLLPTLHRPGYR